MARNGYFGVKNSHIAKMTDETALEYDAPVHVPGTVNIKLEVTSNSASPHADNEVWLDKDQDNGGTGSMVFYDIESDLAIRELIADITGYGLAATGEVLELADKVPPFFAFMCEQPGHTMGKRSCKYKCKAGKPSYEFKTTEDTPEIAQVEIPFTYRPVTLKNGTRMSGFSSFEGLASYKDFFKAVNTELAVKTASSAAAKAPADKQETAKAGA